MTTYSSDENTTHHLKKNDLHRAILLKGLTKIDETPTLLLGRCGRFLPGHLSNSQVLRDVMLNHTAKNDLGVETMTHSVRFQSSQCSGTRSNAGNERFFVHVHACHDKTWLEQVGIGNLDSEHMASAFLTIDGCVKAMMSLSRAQIM